MRQYLHLSASFGRSLDMQAGQVLTGAGVLLVSVAAGSIWIIVRYTNDLTSSRDALSALNAYLEGAVRERTSDLQRANEEIQRFAYIVSHDLRSPRNLNVPGEQKAVIRGMRGRLVDQQPAD